MPCYTPPPTPQEEEQWALRAYARGDFLGFYRSVTTEMLERWLCDVLTGVLPIHEHCAKWFEMHKQREGRK